MIEIYFKINRKFIKREYILRADTRLLSVKYRKHFVKQAEISGQESHYSSPFLQESGQL